MSRWRRRERSEATCFPCIVVFCSPGQRSATVSACSIAELVLRIRMIGVLGSARRLLGRPVFDLQAVAHDVGTAGVGNKVGSAWKIFN